MKYFQKPYLTVIVDDDANMCDYVESALLENFGGELSFARFTNAKEAFEFIKKNPVSILLSDLNMPGLHGEVFLNMVKELRTGIQTITITGCPKISSAFNRYRNGDVNYLIKPILPDEITNATKLALQSLQTWSQLMRDLTINKEDKSAS